MKRALIVDDSRSARVILGRMLEGYGLTVDASESAEQALEYLQSTRPDVIFMDHLMPGMDGFQAVQAIKSNPQTATIPVLMYTSQEGEMYLSQARALGAVGVLPKTVKHADVSRVLYQLQLLPDRREARAAVVQSIAQSVAQVVNDSSPGGMRIDSTDSRAAQFETTIRTAVSPLLKEHGAEMRRFLLATLETFVRRIGVEQKSATATNVSEVAPVPAPDAPDAPAATNPRYALYTALALLALLPTLVLAYLYARTLSDSQALTASSSKLEMLLDEQQQQIAALRQSIEAQGLSTTDAPTTPAPKPQVVLAPYGETPLSGSRLEELRRLVDELRAERFRGRIKVSTYVGDFCLVGNGVEGYSVAADDVPMRRCDLVGNPFEDTLTPAQRQSLGFANLVASLRQQGGGALDIDVEHVGRKPRTPYPTGEQLAKTTAGEWNRIAALNNRVELLIEPMPQTAATPRE